MVLSPWGPSWRRPPYLLACWVLRHLSSTCWLTADSNRRRLQAGLSAALSLCCVVANIAVLHVLLAVGQQQPAWHWRRTNCQCRHAPHRCPLPSSNTCASPRRGELSAEQRRAPTDQLWHQQMRRGEGIAWGCPMGRVGRQWASMGINVRQWSNFNKAKNGVRGGKGREPQAP
jgi:hypothetical protein